MTAQEVLSVIGDACRDVATTLLADEPRVRLFVFGSRASGRADARSDVDVGIDLGRPVPPEVMARLRDAIESLPMLQRVDLVDFAVADPDFARIALEHVVVLYERQAA